MFDRENDSGDREYRPRGAGRQRKGSAGIGLSLWVIAAVFLFILFLVNQGKIISNLKETGFFSRVFGKTPSFVENAPASPSSSDKNDVAPISQESSGSGINIISSVSSSFDGGTQTTPSQGQAPLAENNVDAAQEAGKQTANLGKTMDLKLYFMSINSNGSVVRTEVTRSMPKTSSPLYDSINALISGPSAEEEAKGCRTLVSTGTRLLGASVSSGVATLNFSSEFEFNQYGIEGTRGQLQQIVFTVTAFPTVESVQFLVDGEKRDYLGSEGVWIGSPLNRNNF
ncbi:MAG: GerMN domain-containing protein [Treponema sp.]|nr:GerMN domain-containing protein [Treponema sp.]